MIQIRYPLESQDTPKIGQTNVRAQRAKFHRRVKRKRGALRHETGERITVEMISVRRVSGPVGVGIVRRNDPDNPTGLRYPMKLADEGHNVRHVLDHVTANDLIKLIVGERIRQLPEIVNDVRARAGV